MIRRAKVGDRVVQLRPIALHGTIVCAVRRGRRVQLDVMRDNGRLRTNMFPAELIREEAWERQK